MTDETLDEPTVQHPLPHDPTTAEEPTAAESTDGSATPSATSTPPQYGVGPFSLREIVLAGVWLVAFVVSFFPVSLIEGPVSALTGGANVWVSGLSWVLAIGLPTAAVFLIALRRLSPQGIRRVGSLGIDQFASVAFSVAALVWISWLWETVSVAIQYGVWARSWVVWVEAILFLIGVVVTVFAPLLPVFSQDFAGREEIPAHRNARPVRPVTRRPAPVRPAPKPAQTADSAPDTGYVAPQTYDTGAQPAYDQHRAPGQYETADHGAGYVAPQPQYDSAGYVVPGAGASGTHDDAQLLATDVFAPLTDDSQPIAVEPGFDETVVAQQSPSEPQTAQQPATQAFWALVPEERDVVDEYGRPLFRIGPTAWALVIEDRGAAFVVRHEDGRIGFLHDVSNVTRG